MKWSTSPRVDFYLLERQTRACSCVGSRLQPALASFSKDLAWIRQGPPERNLTSVSMHKCAHIKTVSTPRTPRLTSLHVEYAEREKEAGILFMLSLFFECIHLEYVRVRVISRVNHPEFVIHILVVASQECVNIYSPRRLTSLRMLKCASCVASASMIRSASRPWITCLVFGS